MTCPRYLCLLRCRLLETSVFRWLRSCSTRLHLDNFRISTESPRSCRPSACNQRCSRHGAITTNIHSILRFCFYELMNILRLQINRVFGKTTLSGRSAPIQMLCVHFRYDFSRRRYQCDAKDARFVDVICGVTCATLQLRISSDTDISVISAC